MKKPIFNVFIISIIVLSVIACFLGLTDDAFQIVYPSKNVPSYLINSIKYFIFWVLPYWWIIIVGGSLLITFLYWSIKKIFK
ncbi:hypothetical protein MP478_15990 [Chryseobacterium sp. WG14]|uniref:hypothetical protein n=1 Tax=Chryseobacterium sp. WG14 TaxID=2926909 RepID=UPI00211E1057|nr:hypothetical protein [Chryseobacterium sp. WG14]MCQ9640887.1 hypothetical protein [Chryseobacterium sp. WG14]